MGGRKRDGSEPSEGPPRLLHNEIAIMQKLCKIMQKAMQKVVPLHHVMVLPAVTLQPFLAAQAPSPKLPPRCHSSLPLFATKVRLSVLAAPPRRQDSPLHSRRQNSPPSPRSSLLAAKVRRPARPSLHLSSPSLLTSPS